MPDAAVDASAVPIDALAFATPTAVTTGAGNLDTEPTATANLLELFFHRNGAIFRVGRNMPTGSWSLPTVESSLNTPDVEDGPDISGDGMTLFFIRNTTSQRDIWTSTRPSGQLWMSPIPIYELDPGGNSAAPARSRDGTMVVFERLDEPFPLWFSTIAPPNPWVMPRALTEFADGPMRAHSPMLSTDKLTIYFHASNGTNLDLYEAHRASITDPFGPPTPLPGVNTDADERDPWVSSDGKELFFASSRNGGSTIWHAQR